MKRATAVVLTEAALRLVESSMKAYHGTSLAAAKDILKRGFKLSNAGARQKALRGEEVAEVNGVYLTENLRRAEWYATENLSKPGFHRGGAVVTVQVKGKIASSKEWWTIKRQVDDTLGEYNIFDQKERRKRIDIAVGRTKDRGYAGFYESEEEFIVFETKNVKAISAVEADSGRDLMVSGSVVASRGLTSSQRRGTLE